MLKNPEDIYGRGKRFARKVVSKRRDIPKIVTQKTKHHVRPYYQKSKKLSVKSKYATKFALSAKFRQLHWLVSGARALYENQAWEESINAWQKIIDKYGDKAPIEAFVSMSRAQQQVNNYDAAYETVVDRIEDITKRVTNANSVNQSTLVNWLELSKQKAEITFRKRLADIDKYKSEIEDYQHGKKTRSIDQPKIAVVSAVSGGYDAFRPPVVPDPRIDYIVYSDTPVEDPGIYDVRPLPYIDADSTRSARFVKTNISNLLPEYDYVMWIDANILITGEIYPMFDRFMKSGKEFSAMLHPTRKSPYEEMDACIRGRKDDVEAIREQKEYYKKQGYETEQLIESNILFYNINGSKIDEFLNLWWTQIDRFSRRDQFSINYALDKTGVKWDTFTAPPNTSRNHPDFALMDHGKGSSAFRRMMVQLGSKLVDPFLEQINSPTEADKPIKTISAIVCVHNAAEDVRICLDSVAKHREKNLDLIVVDDGSDQPARDVIEEFMSNYNWIRLIRHEKALGYTRAATAGLKESTADLSILLNSDTIVTKNWAGKMAKTLNSNKGTGIVGPMSSAASHQSIPDHQNIGIDQTAINNLPQGITVEDMNNACEVWSSGRVGPRVPLVHGFCYGIRREVIDAIGYLDAESFPRGYGEENDYCFRAANAGFGLIIATDTYVFHSKSKSFISDERARLMEDGSKTFRDLHGQRRITRAINTMRQNPYLQRMRGLAGSLYRRQSIRFSKTIDHAVMMPGSHSLALTEYPYLQLQQKLIESNDSFIDWSRLKDRSKASDIVASVVVLVLNNIEMTERCIESVMSARTETKFELVVVDNGSNLDTLRGLERLKQKHPEMVFVANDQNYNFALGNNIGFSFARGKYSVFLNNDTYVTDRWLDALLTPLLKREAVITQSLLVYPAGDVQSAGVVFGEKTTLGYALYAGQSFNSAAIRKDRVVDAATGACLAISSKEFAKLKGFDPEYINGQEDVDLCLRAKRNIPEGKIMVVTDSVVYHDESRTPGRGRYRYENRQLFVDRWSKYVSVSDQQHYIQDGYKVISWKLESQEGLDRGVPIYTPVLARSNNKEYRS